MGHDQTDHDEAGWPTDEDEIAVHLVIAHGWPRFAAVSVLAEQVARLKHHRAHHLEARLDDESWPTDELIDEVVHAMAEVDSRPIRTLAERVANHFMVDSKDWRIVRRVRVR